ncbi:LAFA_0D00826g1_1 [Lachancea sp. 'fantastica']|nr:LAFA_0D00826g1_1 [Lachancea sp. 'fantastica']
MPEPLLTSIVAGSTAAVFQTTVSYPFEFLKTGLQLHRSLPGMPPFQMMHQIKTYFAGCAALNVGTLLKTATRFTTFESACELLRDKENTSQPISGPRLLAAGVITGFMESILVIPFENIKTTMIENALRSQPAEIPSKTAKDTRPTFHAAKQPSLHPRQKWFLHYESHPSTHFFSTIQEIYRTRGIRGFAQGSVCTIIRQTSNSAVRFTTYTALKQLISPTKPLNEYYAFALGVASSCAVVAVTQPIDVVKTRMQSKYAWRHYKNSLNCAYRTFVEEGITKLWKGWAPRLVKVGLSGGVSFGVFQYVENLMNSMDKAASMGHN